jgi:hypothetical protein
MRFLLRLRISVPEADAIRRLRQLLKIARRRFEFVCIDAREEHDEFPAQPGTGRAHPAQRATETSDE